MTTQTAPAEVLKASAEIKALHARERELVKSVEHLIVGRRVMRHGVVYKVTRAGPAIGGGHIDMQGARVDRNGKVGTREFNIGFVTLAEFLPECADGVTEDK